MYLPKPKTLADTGLSKELLLRLTLRHLQEEGTLSMPALSDRLCLRGSVVEPLLQELKILQLVEVRASGRSGDIIRYALTAKGQYEAQELSARDGYIGPAPIPLEAYNRLVRSQALGERCIRRDQLEQALSDMVISQELVNTLGPALNSRRPLLIYGHAGTGKSFLCRRFNKIFDDDTIYVPHAIAVQNTIIPIFDLLYHWRADDPMHNQSEDMDSRYVPCKRPLVMVGGELKLDTLEVHFDRQSRQYRAPLQMKANNGVFLIDDLGRQGFAADALFNRWIVPMEERRDFLSLPNGLHFDIPFEQILVFSTNLDPETIADEAFLRRLGYKIELGAMPQDLYKKIWLMNLEKYQLVAKDSLFAYMVDELHENSEKPLIACYPRDILGIARDIMHFNGQAGEPLDEKILKKAWSMYCVH
ncbi:putative ATPase with chaperone activity [Oceanisphaera litoralis]|uniref:AAA family ATPase n=1 Tax=Oceanisphaera litoralis TaxID=225144 RepID=UPI0019569E77|nr:AAA family ATPase [Oceanisphaera litoralis]MBM7454247.1 putative ATPase with chaperone activity [Oceanisphaera litoralis]